MSQPDIVVPVATADTEQCMITPRWFVENSEYHPVQASYLPLINGEEAFAAVHHAIANAQKSVDIICWGFQPSMYFIRDGKSPCIGELLVKIAQEKQVKVRVLAWEMPANAAGAAGEANLPGTTGIAERAGQTATDSQHHFDHTWFRQYTLSGVAGRSNTKAVRQLRLETMSPLFISRGFSAKDRREIGRELKSARLDEGLSTASVLTMEATVTHHQKTVLVDYELPEHAVGFVMGHNMLDEYWDTSAHSAQCRGKNQPEPDKGPRGALPRQDISSRVTGPILEHLHDNFASAWRHATGQDLYLLRHAQEVAKALKPRVDLGTPVMAQLARTQAQLGKRDIEKLYLQATSNATQFIYIENQYFRWPPLAEFITKAAKAQVDCGRTPGKDGVLHLFVVTNVTDEGIGSGTVNTQRMLACLGQANTIPKVTELLRIQAVVGKAPLGIDPGKADAYSREMSDRAAKLKDIDDEISIPQERPGLKVHICSLVAKDSPPDEWMPVYIHSKLMIIDDVFTTHGSANINTRSMQVDSEINIAHEWASVTQAMRRRLWDMHTAGKGGQDDAELAFKEWGRILNRNKRLQKTKKAPPEAPLIQFYYNKPTLSNLD